ncbi:MAG TPA: serine/threonine-protein kinase [Polyangiaceae bacterium]|jgi:serine/threonine protein kinase
MMTEGQELVGSTIAGKYRLRRLIGVGGMGSVYEGQHLDLAKKVAVKIIDSASIGSSELATRFKREARAASAVESENIVQVFDVGRDPEVGLYMVMELLQGEDLEMRLRKQLGRRLDPVTVAQLGYQIARALLKAHTARVIHRDLKPANIFLTDREDGSLRVKILDFGISKLLASEASIATGKEGLLNLTAAGVALGTPQYMSPEQAQGLTTVDHRTDIWGLGVVMYEALAGVPAYPELSSYQETILKILGEKPKPLAQIAPWVPTALARLVHEAVTHDVNKRIQDCATFAQRIAEAVPEAILGSSGPFDAAHHLARLSLSQAAAARASLAQVAHAPNPPAAAPASARRPPITLGDDTQVVVRPSDADPFDDNDPSNTMLARPASQVDRDEAGAITAEDQAPDPTMFQAPAWVGGEARGGRTDPGGEGPPTLKSTPPPGSVVAAVRGVPIPALAAAAITAVVIVFIGGLLLMLFTSGGSEPANGEAGVSTTTTESTSAPVDTAVAAPPATGTAGVDAQPR